MEKCKCGLAWVLTQHDVDVSYRGLIRCVCERPLINWAIGMDRSSKRLNERKILFTFLPKLLVPFLLSPLKSHKARFLCNRWCLVVVV